MTIKRCARNGSSEEGNGWWGPCWWDSQSSGMKAARTKVCHNLVLKMFPPKNMAPGDLVCDDPHKGRPCRVHVLFRLFRRRDIFLLSQPKMLIGMDWCDISTDCATIMLDKLNCVFLVILAMRNFLFLCDKV